MQIQYTEALMRRKLEEKAFGSYAVLVGLGADERIITSPDVNGDTYFDIASCGKVLHTTPLILQAISEGRLTLDTTLPEFFPGVPGDKRGITVRQLLTHSSGIVRCPLPREVCAQGDDATARYILQNPLAFAPGSSYAYSCNGMNLLGFMLEKIYGKLMSELFEERIKRPLGMTRSTFLIAIDEPNAVVCYNRREAEESRFDDANVRAMGRVCGAGGSFFTMNDLIKFVNAVRAKSEILYPVRFYDMAERDYTPHDEEGRGLGWVMVDQRYSQTGTLFPQGSFGHCGHCGQSIFINRALDLHVIILSNATRYENMKSGFIGYNYANVMALRAEIHNAIRRDLEDQLNR